MKIRIIAPVERFNLENNHIGVDLNGINLLRGQDVINDIAKDDKLLPAIGKINVRIIERSYVLYFEGKSMFDENKVTSVSQIASLYLDHFHSFFNNLWFIKDNSSALTTCYVQNLDTGEIGYSHKPLMVSDSQEEYNTYEYSLSEIKQLADLYDQIIKYTEVENGVIDTFKQDEQFFTGSILNYIIRIDNRICRALIFLDSVRTFAYLPQKIAAYIAVFECLFTTSNGELTHQVSERVALFVGSDSKERVDLYNLVKKCYSIRSSFVHGDIIKMSRQDLLNHSSNIDSLARKVMLKVIAEPNLFLKNQSGGKYPIDDYFKELLFK